MSSFGGAVAHCLGGLFRFGGRDSRSQFWFYVLALFIAQQVVSALAVVPLLTMHMVPPRAAGVADGTFADFQRYVVIFSVATAVAAILLLAAAVVRRLHDSGLSGGWGALPLPFLAFGTVQMSRLIDAPGFDRGAFYTIVVGNLLYLVALAALVVLLVRGGDPRGNRHGPPPVAR